MSKPPKLVQGTLDLLILKILELEPRSGWAIGQRLRQASNDTLQVSDGSLYPALHKLEQQGWVTAEWQVTANKRRAKVSRAHASRPQVPAGGARELGASLRGDHAGRAADGGLSHAAAALGVRMARPMPGTARPRPRGPRAGR